MPEATEITRIEYYPLNVPLIAPFDIAVASQSSINNVAVRVTLAGGSRGWGEIPTLPPLTREDQVTAMRILAHEGDLLTGRDAMDWRGMAMDLMARMPDYAAVRCGLEMALLDALAHSQRLPLFRFFGGHADAVVTDITIPICPADEAERLAGHYRRAGFDTIKTKIGRDIDSDINRIIAICRGFSDCRLVLDANSGFTVTETLYLLDELHKCAIMPALLEQPVGREDRDGMARLTREAGVPVAADESCRSPEDARTIARERLAHVINIKPAKSGVVQSLEIAEIAKTNYMGLMIGGMVETRIAMGFSAHFAAGLGGFDWIDLDTPLLLAEDPVVGGYITEGPCYRLDTGGCGHGGELSGCAV